MKIRLINSLENPSSADERMSVIAVIIRAGQNPLLNKAALVAR